MCVYIYFCGRGALTIYTHDLANTESGMKTMQSVHEFYTSVQTHASMCSIKLF